MDNSIYVTLSRQLALFREMDVTAGNIANANTSGYGAERMLFNSYMTKDVNQGNQNPMAFAYDISTYHSLEQGSMKTTGNPLDVSISGSGYFMVQTPLGTRYTRAGNFQIDGTGQLITAEGHPVLDNSSQPIIFPEDANVIEIGSIGNIKVDGIDASSLGVVVFENERVLQRAGGSYFRSDVEGVPTEEVKVLQGVLEGSNVQPVLEMTHMIEVSRSVTNTAKFIEVIYDLQRKAANSLAQQA